MLVEPVRCDREGWIRLSEKPGLGVELDEKRLAATRV
jgi:L-alanine-DL-glutamate epimerase-like enolase superfamily enzyme